MTNTEVVDPSSLSVRNVGMRARDYAQEMDELVAKAFAGHDPIRAATVAKQLVNELEEKDPELLDGWLRLRAEDLLRRQIGLMQSSQRSHNRAVAGRKAFAEAREAFEQGNPEPMARHMDWLSTYFVVDNTFTRKKLGDCTGKDLSFVAKGYETRARTARFEAQFFEQLAQKVGDDLVSDHYTEEQIVKFRESLASFYG